MSSNGTTARAAKFIMGFFGWQWAALTSPHSDDECRLRLSKPVEVGFDRWSDVAVEMLPDRSVFMGVGRNDRGGYLTYMHVKFAAANTGCRISCRSRPLYAALILTIGFLIFSAAMTPQGMAGTMPVNGQQDPATSRLVTAVFIVASIGQVFLWRRMSGRGHSLMVDFLKRKLDARNVADPQ